MTPRDDAPLLDILKLIHHYSVIDLDEVWKAVSVDAPKLIQNLSPLAPKPRE